MSTDKMENPLDFSSLPDLPRPSSSAYNRTSWSPSRSPARSPTRFGRGAYYDYGSVYKDLSPGTTLRVIKASLEHASNLHISDEKLVKSIDTASIDDKNFGLKCAESSKLVKAWVDELEEWPWDWDHGVSRSGSFIRGSTGFPIPTPNSEDERNLRSIESQDSMVKDLPQFEQRLDEIRQDLRDLDMEEQKEFVRNHVQSPTGAHGLPSSADVNHADGLTALVTMTVLQSLPYYSRLLTLIACWSARLTVYQEIPNLRRQIEAAREALGVAWSIVTKDKTFLTTVGEEHASVIARSKLTQDFLDSLKTDLRDVITGLGKKLDGMLDMLRRNGDDLPHKWIDAVEALEHDFHNWTLEAPKIFVKQESQPSRKNSAVPDDDQRGEAVSDTKTHRVSMAMANEMLQSLVSNHQVGEEVSHVPPEEPEKERPTTVIYKPEPNHQGEAPKALEDWSNGSFFRRSSSPEVEATEPTPSRLPIRAKPAITVEDPTARKIHIRDASTDFSAFDFGVQSTGSSQEHERGRSSTSPSRNLSLRTGEKNLTEPSNTSSAEETPTAGIAHSMSWDELDEHIATRTFVKPGSPGPTPSAELTPQKPLSQTTTTPLTTLSTASSSFKPGSTAVSPWDELDDHIADRKFWKPPSPSPAKQTSRIPKKYLRGANVTDDTFPQPPSNQQGESRPVTAWDELDEHIATRGLVQPLPKDLPRPPRSIISSDGEQLLYEENSPEQDEPVENFETADKPDDIKMQLDEPTAGATESFLAPLNEKADETRATSESDNQIQTTPPPPAIDPSPAAASAAAIEDTNVPDKTESRDTSDYVEPIEVPQSMEEPRTEKPPTEEVKEPILENNTKTEPMLDIESSKTVATPEPELPKERDSEETALDSADIPLPSIEPSVEPEASTEELVEEKDVSDSMDDDERDRLDELDSNLDDADGSPLSLTTSRPRTASTFDGDSALAALEYASPISETPEYDASQAALPDIDDEEDAQGKYEDVVKDLKVKKTRKPHLQTYTNKDLGLDEHGNPLKVKYKYKHARHLSDADRKLEQKIDSILPNIPASIEFKKEPARSPGQAILEQFKKRSAIRKGLATPDLTLEPAFQQTTKSSRSGFASEIKLYHLTSADRAEPIKLYVRLVGESAERVMVRVGGGWADLGEYLRDFAMHHARVASAGDAKARPASRMASLSPTSTSANTTDRRNFSLPSKLPMPKNAGNNSNLSTNNSRTASRLSTRTASRQGSRATSRASPRPDDEAPTLGMSGPKSNTGAANDMSEEQQRWVDTMLERAKEFRPSEKGGPTLEDMGRVNNTRRVYKVADASGSGSNGNVDR